MVWLWDIEEQKTVGRLDYTGFNEDIFSIRFSKDGAGITVFGGGESRSWKIVRREALSSTDSNQSPVAFVPLGTPFDDASPALYKHDRDSEWITAQDGKRVFWLPPDLRDPWSFHCQGSKVAMGFGSGRVCWFDFCSLSASN